MSITLIAALTLAAGPQITLRVEGEGYLRVDHAGNPAYARQITLVVSHGQLMTASGDSLLPQISLPEGTKSVDADLEGHIYARTASGRKLAGDLILAEFTTGTHFEHASGLLETSARPHLG